MLRQQWERKGQTTFSRLADFIAPVDSGRQDYLGAFAVTAGIGADELVAQFEADHDDYNSIMAKALADRLAEAFAECLHAQARRDWGYGRENSSPSDDLIDEKYRGIRPAPGYPACPTTPRSARSSSCSTPRQPTGIRSPKASPCSRPPASAASTSPIREARYFAVDRITRDQVESYAAARECPSPKSSAGWRRTWGTTRSEGSSANSGR